MLFWLACILLILSGLGFRKGYVLNRAAKKAGNFSEPGLGLLMSSSVCIGLTVVFLVFPCIITAAGFVSDRSYVKYADQLIATYQDELGKLDKQIAEASGASPNVMHLNADTPVKSIVEARLKVANSLVEIRTAKTKRMIDINTARTGLFYPVIWIVE